MSVVADRGAPSTAAIVIATAIVGALGGYFLGQASSIGIFGQGKSSSAREGTDDTESDSEEEEDPKPGEFKDFATTREEFKMVLVVRTDLGMTKGKIAAQCGHAVLACHRALQKVNSPILAPWQRRGEAMIAVQVKSEEELELLQAQALSLGICARIIHDAGRTQIAAGSATVLGVGPAPRSAIDQVTGQLKLL